MQEKLENLSKIAKEELESAKSSEKLDELRVKYLGKKGELTLILKTLGSLSPEERKTIGMMANKIRGELESIIEEKKESLKLKEIDEKIKKEKIDISISGNKRNEYGHKHPLSIVLDDIKSVFMGMGYSIAEGPDIEYTKFNFDSLNTPEDHPARDLQDTMYVTDKIVLRTQTSPVQIRTMLSKEPPIKVICPGRVYRSDSVDATHSPMFHQVEGLVIDKGISMSDLKGTLELFAKNYFGKDTKIRLRPHHFPYTEPSAEVDVSCFVCGGEGCRVCKNEGWIELLGCGMVHPNVLKAGGIDPNVYQGFAFGIGLERTTMKKFGIGDLRYIYDNDVRFLNQF